MWIKTRKADKGFPRVKQELSVDSRGWRIVIDLAFDRESFLCQMPIVLDYQNVEILIERNFQCFYHFSNYNPFSDFRKEYNIRHKNILFF